MSIFPRTLATKFVPCRSLCPLCQQVSLKPPQSSRCPFSCHSTHSGCLTFSKSPPFTLRPSIILLSSHWTSWPFLPWLLLVPCPHRKAYRQPWPWCRERKKLHDYKKKLAEKKTIRTILTARFGEYTRFRSPRTSHTDFPYQRLMSPFFLPTLHVIGKPLEFLVADIKHIASWSEAEGR